MLRVLSPADQQVINSKPGFRWNASSIEEQVLFYRLAQGYRIRFTGLVDFELFDNSDLVTARPVPGTSAQAVEYVYNHHLLPLQRSRSGEEILHGSAVVSKQGALLFLAVSGTGKSTLATYLATQGYTFLSDDAVRLHDDGEGTLVSATSPTVRLWDDSLDALSLCAASTRAGGEYTSKFSLEAADFAAITDEPQKLAGVYLLGHGEVRKPVLEAMPGSRALIELIQHSYRMPLIEKERAAGHFRRLGRHLNGMPCWRLDYPRDYTFLPAVAALLPPPNCKHGK